MVLQGVQANFWRATTDNDFGLKMPKKMNVWKATTKNQVLTALNHSKTASGNVEVIAKYNLEDAKGALQITYTINSEGKMKVNTSVSGLSAELPMLPRFGNNFIIKNEFNQVTWFGRGPHENYQDRNTSAMVGLYQASVSDLYFPYIRPQENGYKTDTRWVTFVNESGSGIKITGEHLISFSAHHQYNDDFDSGEDKQQRHTTDIKKRDLVNINIDYKQMGVGGDTSWGRLPHKAYRILPEDLSYSYSIEPIKK